MTGGTATLQSGIYVLGGKGLNISGGEFIAHGVMFYVLNGTKTAVKLGGNGKIDIRPLPLGQTSYGGIAIWQSEANVNPASIQGSEQFTGIDGTLYFPRAQVDITGTSDSFGVAQLICGSIGVSGSGTIHIHYDGRFIAPGSNVFLAE